MLTVNLEKKLIKENKRLLMPNELLQVKEYDKLGEDFCQDDVLDRLGLNINAKQGKSHKEKIHTISKGLERYDQSRVFHVSQIETLCNKYYLRFLQVDKYKGTVDKDLGKKISFFEIANETKCTAYNCYIIAPASSFNLEEKPKDPLFFYSLGNGFYYLVHKWGNDLSLFRRAIPLFSNAFFTWLIPVLLWGCLDLFMAKHFGLQGIGFGLTSIIGGIGFLIWSGICIFNHFDGESIRFIEESRYNNTYL